MNVIWMRISGFLILTLILLGCIGCSGFFLCGKSGHSPVVFQGKDYMAFQFHQVRVYFLYGFENTILQTGGPRDTYIGISRSDTVLFGLFRSGKLTGEMFFKAQADSRKEKFEDIDIMADGYMPSFTDSVGQDMDLRGNAPLVSLQWINRYEENGLAHYSLCVSRNKNEIGGDCECYYFILREGEVEEFRFAGCIL